MDKPANRSEPLYHPEKRGGGIIAEDDDEYVAVFVIIPEDCRSTEETKRIFPRYVTLLRTALAEMYPGHILKRINSQHIQIVG